MDWLPLAPSVFRTKGFVFSSSRTPLFRISLDSGTARGEENLEQLKARRGKIALSHQIIDIALKGPAGSEGIDTRTRYLVVADRRHTRQWGRYADAIARWEHITG